MHVNKVSHVTTVDCNAAQLGKSVDILFKVANALRWKLPESQQD